MLSVIVCVGSSCYVRGSELVAEKLERLIREHDLAAQVEVSGAFCMDQCSMGVSVRVGDRVYRCVHPKDIEAFFAAEVLPQAAALAPVS